MTEKTNLEPFDAPAASDTDASAVPTDTADEVRRAEAGIPGKVTIAEAPAAPQPEPSEDPAELRRQRDEYYDLLLRKTAEFDNYRKRVDRERREFAEVAAADVLLDLLAIVDDLERALQSEPDNASVEAYRRGVEMIHRKLMDVLRKRGVTPIGAVGTDFDPRLHQAVAYEVSPGRREGEITEEYQRGYKLGDRLLRPSMVKVAKA